MGAKLSDPYGSFLPTLLFHDLRDRLQGARARANARWGLLHPPETGGKVLWIASGAARSSVRLGVELAKAIREKRLDVRIVLTFEEEYPDLLASLAGMEKAGWGYGPSDHPAAITRTLKRLAPLGVIFAGVPPRPRLSRRLDGLPHALLVAASCCAAGPGFEKIYPATFAQEESCRDLPKAPVVNLLTLVMPSQVDPVFKTLANGPAERPLWWWHGDDTATLAAFLPPFRERFPRDPLFVSGEAALPGAGSMLSLKNWDRNPFPPGSVIPVDDPKWLPALAAACTAIHLDSTDPDMLWQAMAGGAAVSVGRRVVLPKEGLSFVVARLDDTAAVVEEWVRYSQDPPLARAQGDRARRAFWEERRLAAQVAGELLQRVFDWD